MVRTSRQETWYCFYYVEYPDKEVSVTEGQTIWFFRGYIAPKWDKVGVDKLYIRIKYYIYREGALIEPGTIEKEVNKGEILEFGYWHKIGGFKGWAPGRYQVKIFPVVAKDKRFQNVLIPALVPDVFTFTVKMEKKKEKGLVDYKSLFMLMTIGLIAVAAISAITGR